VVSSRIVFFVIQGWFGKEEMDIRGEVTFSQVSRLVSCGAAKKDIFFF